MTREPIRSVLVVGGGPTAALAAAVFARALRGVTVTRVDLPVAPDALADRLPAVIAPDDPVLEALGLDEEDLLAAGALHRLGLRFERWRADGAAFVQAAGAPGGAAAPGAFHQHWLLARRCDPTVAPYHRHLPAAVLGECDRFAPPTQAASFDYGLALSAERWRALLVEVGARAGVRAASLGAVAPQRDDAGRLRAVRLPDGRRLEADLYVDASGPAAGLAAPGDPREDWSVALPVDRVRLAGPAARTPALLAARTAVDVGWTWTAPTLDGAWRGLAYASGATSDAEAERVLPGSEAPVTLRPGRRRDAWSGAVLALGDAVAVVPPLAEAHTQLAAAAVMRALELMPGRDMAALETAEYNRRTARELGSVRDMAALALQRTSRREGAFWRGAAEAPAPESLAHLADAFLARGRLPHRDDDAFDREAWLSLLLGLGLEPRRLDPLDAGEDPARLAAALRAIAARLAATAARLAPYGAPAAGAARARA